MCRFLIAKSKNKLNTTELLTQFADMAEASRAPDGDRQGDGWGYAIQNLKSKISNLNNEQWVTYTCLKPIWEDRDSFKKIPDTQMLAVHVRSASFSNQKGIISYNQPFAADAVCFVFNGVISGVKIDRPLTGTIGSQKIFSLIIEELRRKNPSDTLRFVDRYLLDHSTRITGLNIGLIKSDKLYALCEYLDNSDYFGLKYYTDSTISLICSENIGTYNWQSMKKGQVISL